MSRGWGARIRTGILGFKVRCLAVGRPPSAPVILAPRPPRANRPARRSPAEASIRHRRRDLIPRRTGRYAPGAQPSVVCRVLSCDGVGRHPPSPGGGEHQGGAGVKPRQSSTQLVVAVLVVVAIAAILYLVVSPNIPPREPPEPDQAVQTTSPRKPSEFDEPTGAAGGHDRRAAVHRAAERPGVRYARAHHRLCGVGTRRDVRVDRCLASAVRRARGAGGPGVGRSARHAGRRRSPRQPTNRAATGS